MSLEASTQGRQPIDVLAGVLRDARGCLLVCQRPPGKHLAGLWEFPGGKRDPGESRFEALARELREELAIEVIQAAPLTRIRHDYLAAPIRLDAWQVLRWRGEPTGLEGQAVAWVSPAELPSWPLAPADRHILTAARLPDRLAITPEPDPTDLDAFLRGFEKLHAAGIGLVQLRAKALPADTLESLARQCHLLSERHAGDLMLNGEPALAARLGVGLHLPSSLLRRWHAERNRPDSVATPWLRCVTDAATDAARDALPSASSMSRQARGWLAASCHDAEELAMAAAIGCDFALLAPVSATASHPHAVTLGWDRFGELVNDSAIPVYALGGMSQTDGDTARNRGARGIAGIRTFWSANG